MNNLTFYLAFCKILSPILTAMFFRILKYTKNTNFMFLSLANKLRNKEIILSALSHIRNKGPHRPPLRYINKKINILLLGSS